MSKINLLLPLPWQEVLSLPGPVVDDLPVNVDVDQLWRHGVPRNTRLISKEFVIVSNMYLTSPLLTFILLVAFHIIIVPFLDMGSQIGRLREPAQE